MEENITTTLADFWVTETTFYQEGYYTDYITNQDKRITTDLTPLVGEEWWKNYATIYRQYRDNGKLIFRAKAVTDDNVTVYQVYPTKEDRDQWLVLINDIALKKAMGVLVPQEKEYALKHQQIIQLIERISKSKCILQCVREDYRTQGMIIGDPIKKDQLTYVQ